MPAAPHPSGAPRQGQPKRPLPTRERDSAGLPARLDVGELEIDPAEAASGTTRRVDATIPDPCPACGGTGAAAGWAVEDCPACGGDGRVGGSPDDSGGLVHVDTCPECDGSGRLVIVPCGRCLGSGRTEAKRKVTVHVPPGAEDGLAVVAEADGGRAGTAAGDAELYVVLRVRADRDDSRLIRYAAGVALVLAVFLLVVLAVAPEALLGR